MPDQKRNASTQLLARLRFGLLAVAMIAAPLMIGSVFFWSAGILAALMLGALLVTVEYNRQRRATLRISTLAVGMFLITGVSLLQLIPLPLAVLEWVAPSVHEIYTLGHQAVMGVMPESPRPISLDPQSTADRALRFLTLGMAAVVAANIRSRNRAWRVVTAALIAAAVASLLIGLLHSVFEMKAFYASYKALIPPKLSTFVSSNHAASLFGLAAIVSLAFAFRTARKEGSRHWLFATSISGVVLFIAMLQGESAGVNLMMPVSFVVFVVAMQPRRRREITRRVAGVVAIVGAAAAWLFSRGFLADTPIGRWLFNSLDIRLELAGAAAEASSDFFLFGAGNGASDQTIYRYVDLQALGANRLVTIENEPFEWLFTLGVPTTILVIACLVIPRVALRTEGETSSRTQFFVALGQAVWLYLTAIALLHFPFLSLGVSLPAIIVFEMITRQVHHLHQSDIQSFSARSYPFWHVGRTGGYALATVCFAAFFALFVGWSVYSGPTDFTSDISEPERAVRLTPGQSRLYVALAREPRKQKDWDRHLALIERAEALEGRVSMQLLHAFALWRSGQRDEAINLWKEIAKMRPTPRRLGQDLARYIGDDPELMARVLAEADPELWRYTARTLGDMRGQVSSIQFALSLADERPGETAPYELVIESYWSAKMWDVAELWSRYLILTGQATDEGPIGWGLYVNTLIRQGDRVRAREAAVNALDQVPGDPAVSGAVMSLRTPDPTRAETDEIETVTKAYSHFCVAPLVGAKRTNCRRAKAWIHETRDEIDEAEDIYRALYEASKDPRELGQFYIRQNRCLALRSLIVKHEDAQREWLERLYLKCSG